MRAWLVCLQCGTKELLNERSKFDGGCLHCGGGPRAAQNDNGEPVVLWSSVNDPTLWDYLPKSEPK